MGWPVAHSATSLGPRHLIVAACLVMLFVAVVAWRFHGPHRQAAGMGQAANADVTKTVEMDGQRVSNGASYGRIASSSAVRQVDAFRSLRSCVLAKRAIESMSRQLAICQDSLASPEGMRSASDDPFRVSCEERRKAFSAQIPQARLALSECHQPDAASLEQQFFVETVLAARHGDPDAQLCYAGASFELDRPWTERERDEYAQVAPGYISSALRRGDWRGVWLLSFATPHYVEQNELLSSILEGDDDTLYRASRLLLRGAKESSYAGFLEIVADRRAPALSQERLHQAEAWIESTYKQSFSRLSVLSRSPDVCLSSPESYQPVIEGAVLNEVGGCSRIRERACR